MNCRESLCKLNTNCGQLNIERQLAWNVYFCHSKYVGSMELLAASLSPTPLLFFGILVILSQSYHEEGTWHHNCNCTNSMQVHAILCSFMYCMFSFVRIYTDLDL